MSRANSWIGRRRPDPLARPADGRKLVLHVGCGRPNPEKLPPVFRGPEWREVRFDIDSGVEPDIIGTTLNMSAVRRDSVDAILSAHNLEHVYAHEVLVVLREFLRVLRPGGHALINVPDLQEIAKVVATGNLEGSFYRSDSGPVTALDVLYGFGLSIAAGNEYMAHRTGFTADTLSHRLGLAGFVDSRVRRERVAMLWATAYKPG